MAVNKVVFGNTTVMDITDSTVDSDTLLTGTRAYGANGDPVIGGVVKSWTGTAAQYAQEASQIPDGTQVNILDDFTPVGIPIGIANIYSTEEREIGVWINGKPLYQRTIVYHKTNIKGNSSFDVTSDLTEVETIYNYKSTVDYSVGSATATAYVDNYAVLSKDGNSYTIKLAIGSSTLTTADITVTIQYTKTADQPGSGKYTPSGAPAVHYSTDEQIIGTWVDGRPLYQKTIVGAITSTSSARAWFDLYNATDLNIDDIFFQSESNYITSGYSIPVFGTLFSQSDNYINVAYLVASHKIQFVKYGFGAGTYKITFNYTKTTDL